MTESLPEKKGEDPSSLDRTHAEFVAALNEEYRLMSQIDKILKTAEDRAVAERLVLDQYAPLVDAAIRHSRTALEEWLADLRRATAEVESYSSPE